LTEAVQHLNDVYCAGKDGLAANSAMPM